jgi:hypothetical protein
MAKTTRNQLLTRLRVKENKIGALKERISLLEKNRNEEKFEVVASIIDRVLDNWRWWASKPHFFFLRYEEHMVEPIKWFLELYWVKKGIDEIFKGVSPEAVIESARVLCKEKGVEWPVKVTFKEEADFICGNIARSLNWKREGNWCKHEV